MNARALTMATAASLVLFGVAMLVGYHALDAEWLRSHAAGGPQISADAYPTSFAGIAARNAGACLLVYSGVLFAGLSTIATLSVVGLYVGATIHLGVAAVGVGRLAAQVGTYAPIEFLAVAIAAVASFLPICSSLDHALRRTPAGPSLSSVYLSALPRSLTVMGASLGCVLIAATLESIVISTR